MEVPMSNLYNDVAKWAIQEHGKATALTLLQILQYWEDEDKRNFTFTGTLIYMTPDKLRLLAKTLHEITGD